MTGRYQVYEEFTSTEEVIIEDFPKHWDLTRIKFNSLVKARVGWHGLKSDDFTEEGPYLVTGSDFKGKFIQWDNCYHCDEERYQQDSYIQLQNGDLLLTKDGTIGKVALVSGLDDKATLNSGVFVVRPLKDGDFTTKYYYWLLLSRSFTDFVDFYKTGSTIVHLYQDTFVNFKYSLPPLSEQQKIANFLDHETAKIDTLIAKQEKLIELLKEKRQAVISHAVTRGLPSSNGSNAPMKDSGVEWLGEVPEHWTVSKCYYESTRVGDGLHSTPKYQDGTGYYFINGNNLVNEEIEIFSSTKEIPSSELENHHIELSDNSVLLSINGTIGNVAVYKQQTVILGKSAAYINCGNKILPKYLLNFLQTDQARRYFEEEITGTVISNLSLNSIRNMRVPIPSLEEQNRIVEYCTKQKNKFDLLLNKTESMIKLVKERKIALISAAVTGKIDVRYFNINKVGE